MTIEQPNVVDIVARDGPEGTTRLIISDHLPWEGDHLLTLQEKINTYLAYLESGEVYSRFPDAKGRDFTIEVVCLHRPSEMATVFFASARSIVENAGFKLLFGPGPDGYAEDAA